jgi:hypothetical protein
MPVAFNRKILRCAVAPVDLSDLSPASALGIARCKLSDRDPGNDKA